MATDTPQGNGTLPGRAPETWTERPGGFLIPSDDDGSGSGRRSGPVGMPSPSRRTSQSARRHPRPWPRCQPQGIGARCQRRALPASRALTTRQATERRRPQWSCRAPPASPDLFGSQFGSPGTGARTCVLFCGRRRATSSHMGLRRPTRPTRPTPRYFTKE